MSDTHDHDGHHQRCGCHEHAPSGLDQDLDEMAFERSIVGAASRNDAQAAKRMLQNGTDPSQRSATGYTALHYFARHGNLDACRMLVEYGADVNALTTTGKATPLHRAARSNRLDVVAYLLRVGANPALADSDGQTALHKAAIASEACFGTVEAAYVRMPGADINAVDRKGRTARDLLDTP
ncbi:hypothetical protein PTSG_08846 [Salpingoeca rosetta]|uniref:Uncharacterized protein n=1 Tax=Salpingoeca rosetta (strain ATCC 50818 / BSB-021) TaxID=946362 RepID=F2UKV8_SALR5|nr:uncharacterized protein PTSG_08846 [Salpingoeca rosetta]EGD77757.1 hypothetical protein PTSG_08846 [Salpingoeca rosetta]|eukprot:XP_004990233.1 hypothetical protein PTSG_08846 [Salpingoeca rosetta]